MTVQHSACQARVHRRGSPVFVGSGNWSLHRFLQHIEVRLSMAIAFVCLVVKPSKEVGAEPSYFLVLKFRPDQRESDFPPDLKEFALGTFEQRRFGTVRCFRNPDGTFVVSAGDSAMFDAPGMRLYVLPGRHLAVYNEGLGGQPQIVQRTAF
ncbi:MAG: hypothetical protein Q8N81_03835 [bacterium]|nr:hypothetical protein [bacterium]